MPTPNLNLPTVPQGATDISVAYNELAQIVDALTPLAVENRVTNAPPTTTSGDVGTRWIIGPSPTGAWSGRADEIALCTGADTWKFIAPSPYLIAWDIAEEEEVRFIPGDGWQ